MRLNPRSDVPYYNRGRAYARKGDRERAISDFNEAIRLNPNGALSYFMRGIEYDIAGDTERAIADFNDAIRLDPKLAGAHDHLGEIYKGKREFDRAIAAYSEAIRQEPRNGRILWHRADTYLVMGELDRAIADYTAALGGDQDGACASCVRFGRGIAYFYAGQLANALADMRAANELDPKDAYVALWVDIIGQRSKAPSRLAQMIAKLDMSKWPAPIVRLYSGQSNAQAVVTAANDGKADDRKRRVCEANFYNAEWALRAGTKEDAAAMFRQAAADCPGDPNTWSIDYTMPANAELKALGATP
jgi:lipoprotein NlpI